MAVAGLIALAVAIPLAEESGVLLFSDPASAVSGSSGIDIRCVRSRIWGC